MVVALHNRWKYHRSNRSSISYLVTRLIIIYEWCYHSKWLSFICSGGPGWSSTAFGNFDEIGPLDRNSNLRNHTWIKDVNVLFIDSPVGTGFSHVENLEYLCENNYQIALDLVVLMRKFLEKFPKFKKVPIHVFSESYGGKMSVEFAWELHKEIENGNITCNLFSVAMGNPFISPKDTTESYGPFLYQMVRT